MRVEYAIFLISAAGAQLFYGLSYILLTFSSSDNNHSTINKPDKDYISKKYYKKSLTLNLIGLTGSMVLILLYVYSLIFPPPLSSNPYPEGIDLAGIIAKSLEIMLVMGVIYLMRTEKKRYFHSLQTFINNSP